VPWLPVHCFGQRRFHKWAGIIKCRVFSLVVKFETRSARLRIGGGIALFCPKCARFGVQPGGLLFRIHIQLKIDQITAMVG
jgi:hypothetical protein